MTFQSNAPATSAPAAVTALRKEGLVTAVYEACEDHNYRYPAGTALDEKDPENGRLAYEAVALGGTKKEIQFALGFHTPIAVTRAVRRHIAATGAPAVSRPRTGGPRLSEAERALQVLVTAGVLSAGQAKAAAKKL